ncbi:MAG: extracellular solute-binding protein [Kineosporiaceae bacterium]
MRGDEQDDVRGPQRVGRRQFLTWAAVAAGTPAFAGTVAGCATARPVAATGPQLGAEYVGRRVQVEFWNGFTGGDGPAMRDLVEQFNRSQDRITVRMNVVRWAQYYQRVVAAVHAGKGPDVGAMHVEQLATQAGRQSISPLDDIVGELGVQASEFPELAWKGGVYGGRRYGLPLDVHSLGSYRNDALADAAPRTRAEFESTLQDLRAKGVPTPFWMPNVWPAHLIFLSLLWQFGGEPYQADGSRATFDSDAGVRALQWMVEQVRNGNSPRDVAADSQYTAFKNGRGAYTWDGVWQVNDLRDTASDLRWSIDPLPRIGDQDAVWANSHQLVLFRTRRPDDDRLLASKAFLRFLLENSAGWARSGLIPARTTARDDPAFRKLPQAALVPSIPAMRFLPQIPALGEVQAQTLEIAVSDAVLGRSSPQAALRAAASQATTLMRANQRKFGEA